MSVCLRIGIVSNELLQTQKTKRYHNNNSNMLKNHAILKTTRPSCSSEFGKWHGKIFVANKTNAYIIGDLHGHYSDFVKSLKMFDARKDPHGILYFLGDYCDGGEQSYELVAHLKEILLARGDIIALKGNHELFDETGSHLFNSTQMKPQALKHSTPTWENFFSELLGPVISMLGTAAIVGRVLLVHGGINNNIHTMADLNNPANEFSLLRNDACEGIFGEVPHNRLKGAQLFGGDVTDSVLRSLGLELIVRGHNSKSAPDGPAYFHNGRIITINSCAKYGRPFMLILDGETLKHTYEFI